MRRVDLSKWPMPNGYGVSDAHLKYEDKFILSFTLHTPKGNHIADMPLYCEQVLDCDSPAYGQQVMDVIIEDLNREEHVPWQP